MNTFNPYVNYRASDGTENPCRQDCPRRGPFCRPGCPDYAKYRAALDKDNRRKETEMDAFDASLSGIMRNKKMRATERKRGRKGYNY